MAVVESPAPCRAGRWLPLVLLAFAAMLFVRLGAAPVHRSNELRVDKVVRGMLETGDLLVPRLDGDTRLQKPPLYYWLATGAAFLCGGPANAPLRAPAALSALALALVAWAWGRRLGGPRLGLLAALALAIMPGVAEFGRLGVAETLLAACCSAAMLAWDRARDGSPRARAAFVAALAGAVLDKGTPALLAVAAPIAVDLLLRRRLRAALSWRNAGLCLLALVPAVAWYVALFVRVPGAWDQVVSFALLPFGVKLPEAKGNAAHVEPFWYHAVALLGLTIPLIPLLPALVLRGVRSRLWREQPGLRLAALSVLVPFAGFSLIPEKQDHYLLPILPPLALLLGVTLLELADRAAEGARGLRIVAVSFCLLLAGGLAGAVWILRGAFDVGWPACAGLVLTGLAAASLVLVAGWRARPLACAAGLAAGVFLLTLIWFGLVDPERQSMDAGVADPAAIAHWNAVSEKDPLLGGVFFVGKAHEAAGG